jgi:hypothetical protein
MKKRLVMSLSFLVALMLATPGFSQKSNKLSKSEKADGWKLLFDGNSFDGWRQCNSDAMPENWEIEQGAMKVFLGKGKKEGQGSGGDILYAQKKFEDFELSIDWKASPKANSGIFYAVQKCRVNRSIMLLPRFRCWTIKMLQIIKWIAIWQGRYMTSLPQTLRR